MAKLLAQTRIILPAPNKDGVERVVPKGQVFDATPEQARQFDSLKAARPATKDEITKAKVEADKANGIVPAEPEQTTERAQAPVSGAAGDPNSPPKGK